MPSNTRNLHYAARYEDCEQLFKKPPVKGKHWLPNERPLGNNRQHHYRVEKDGDAFKAVLYRTTMAEYRKLPNGGAHTKYQWHYSMTSTGFMHNVVGTGRVSALATTEGTTVRVPLADAGWASLVFDADGRLDVVASDHGETYTYRSNAEDRRRRKEALLALQPWLNAALIKLDGRSVWVPNQGSYFYGAFTAPLAALPLAVCTSLYTGKPSQQLLQDFLLYAGAAWTWLHGRAEYDNKPPPTIEQLETYLQRKYLRVLGLDKGSDKVAKPKFPVR